MLEILEKQLRITMMTLWKVLVKLENKNYKQVENITRKMHSYCEDPRQRRDDLMGGGVISRLDMAQRGTSELSNRLVEISGNETHDKRAKRDKIQSV